MRLALAAVACLLVAGCGQPAQDPTSTSDTRTPGDDPFGAFDGQAAWQAARALTVRVLGDEEVARPRHPGQPGHAEAIRMLLGAMHVEGWEVTVQAFNGTQYLAAPKGVAQTYVDAAAYCSPAERERVEGLQFGNLIAKKPAAAFGEDGSPAGSAGTLVLGAHWDSKANATSDPDPAKRGHPVPAANDAASGVGILLQLMRHIAVTPLPYDVQVVLFDGEDGFEDCHPLAGSTMFVRGLAPGAVDRMLLLDMVGDPDAVFPKESASHACDPALVDLVWGIAQRAGLAQFTNRSAGASDDHTPFIEAGIPAVDIIGFGADLRFLPYWHTTSDTMDNLDPAFMGKVGDVLVQALQDPRFVSEWPSKCANA